MNASGKSGAFNLRCDSQFWERFLSVYLQMHVTYFVLYIRCVMRGYIVSLFHGKGSVWLVLLLVFSNDMIQFFRKYVRSLHISFCNRVIL